MVVLHVVVGEDLRQHGDVGIHQRPVSSFMQRQNLLLVILLLIVIDRHQGSSAPGRYFLHLPQMCNLTLGRCRPETGMGFLSYLLYPWGIILQGLAIVHFIRRRPENYWIFVILFLVPLPPIIYLAAEALPDI